MLIKQTESYVISFVESKIYLTYCINCTYRQVQWRLNPQKPLQDNALQTLIVVRFYRFLPHICMIPFSFSRIVYPPIQPMTIKNPYLNVWKILHQYSSPLQVNRLHPIEFPERRLLQFPRQPRSPDPGVVRHAE